MNNEDLKTRVRNPNKEFDSYFWRPKSLFLRRLLAKYIGYIEIGAYLFLVILAGSIIYAWTVKHDEWTGFKGGKLVPLTAGVKSFVAGKLEHVFVCDGDSVEKGDTIILFRSATNNTPAVLAAPSGGIVSFPERDSTGKLPSGKSLDTGTIAFSILDFSGYTFENEFDGANIDSITVGDSAQIEIQKKYDANLVMNGELKKGKSFPLRPFMMKSTGSDPFIDSLMTMFKDRAVTARQQGVYKVTSVESPALVLEYELAPQDKPWDAGKSMLYSSKPFYGVFEKGVRKVKLEAAKPFADSILARIRSWSDSMVAQKTMELDGKKWSVEKTKLIKAKTIMMYAEAPLESYVPFKKRPKALKEFDQKEFKVKGTIRVSSPPAYVRELALLYYRAAHDFLDVNVRINSYEITWGKKLIRKN